MIHNEILGKVIVFAKTYKYVLIVIGAGLILLLTSALGGSAASLPAEGRSAGQDSFSLESEEKKLQDVLKVIYGVGKTEVILTLKTTTETIYLTDTETSTKSTQTEHEIDTKTKSVTISAGSGNQEAVIVKRIYPEYRGALIVCEGGDDPKVKLKVTEAVSALTGLSFDKITVLMRN